MAETPDLQEEFKNDPEFKRASLGIEVEHFIHNDKVGKYLMKRARAVRQETSAALAVVDPTDASTVRELQWQYRIPDLIVSWLEEAIANGRAAERNIELEEKGYQ